MNKVRVCRGLVAAGMALIMGIASPALASTEDEDRFQALVQEAVKAREAGDMERTAVMLRQAIELNPVPEMLNNLGRVYEDLGRYADAVEVYQKVVDDETATAVLRRLDATRIELLAGRLEQAWLAIDSQAADMKVFVDGAPLSWIVGKELGVDPGQRALQFSTPDGKRSQLLFGDLEKGRRTPVTVSLGSKLGQQAQLSWTASASPVNGLSVNGVDVAGAVGELEALHLAPGRYVVEVAQQGHQPVTKAVQLESGSIADLTADLQAAAKVIPLKVVEESSPMIPITTMGVGGVVAGVGAVLLVGASTDRDQAVEVDAEGFALRSMAEAQELESSANSKGMGGSVMVGVGVAAAAAGLVWFFMDSGGESPSESESAWWWSPGPDGVVMGGSF